MMAVCRGGGGPQFAKSATKLPTSDIFEDKGRGLAMRLRFLALLALLVGIPAAHAQSPAPAADAAGPTASVAAEPPAMTVPVMINGQGPFQFAIDSGSTTTL